jgi:flagellar biogenesis protein FliO
MARIVEREVVPVETTDGGNSTASNFIWALALIIIVALIVFGVWKSGILRQVNTAPEKKINVEVQNH